MKPFRWLWGKVVGFAKGCAFLSGIPFVILASQQGMLFGVLRHSKDQESEAMLIVDGAVKTLTVDQAHRVLQGAYTRYVSQPLSVTMAQQILAARESFGQAPPKGETFH